MSIRSDGYANSEINYLGEDGLVLGMYSLYNTDDTLLGNRAFAFSIEEGVYDLGSLVDGGLALNDWSVLDSALGANQAGQIIGTGLLSDMYGGSMGYILTPTAVPVPGALWLFGSGLLALIGMSKRRQPAYP